jgi:hypothetical protein
MTNEEFQNTISVRCEDYFQSSNCLPQLLLVPENWNYDFPVDHLVLIRSKELHENELVMY